MDTIEAIRTRRSIRSYQSRPLERDLIECVILDAAQAPPPFSGQVPWTFHVVAGVERIAAYGARAMQYARDHRLPGTAPWLDRPDFRFFWDAPVFIVISGPSEDCARAGQNLMLSAHARGLGTCWVGAPMSWLRTPEAKTELGIPENMTPAAVLCLGYPQSTPAATPRAKPPIVWVS